MTGTFSLPKLDLVIFDLDGTLIDSATDLVNAVNATRSWLGMPGLDPHVVASYVGNGAPVLIRRAIGPEPSDDELRRALDYFLNYYREHILDHTTLYPGARDALEALHRAGVHMAVLTNKPIRFSKLIVEGLGLHGYFYRVYGGNSFPDRKKPDPIGIDTLRHELNASRQATLMVGDSAIDVETARNAGVAAAGVTFGFQPETFASNPPDILFDRMDLLAQAILAARG